MASCLPGYRVVHLPTSVGGNPQGLSSHLNKLGVTSESWIFQQNVFNYPSTRVIWSEQDGPLAREIKRWQAIFRVAWTFDVIHFNFGSSWATPVPTSRASDRRLTARLRRYIGGMYLHLASLCELNLYRLFRRAMLVHYQGDDARQGDVCLAKFDHSVAQYVDQGYYTPESDELKRRMIKRMDKYCQKVYAVNPDLLYVLSEKAQFVPYCHISLDDWKPVGVPLEDRPLRIGHAPSHRKVKGTDIILEVLDELAAEGHRFELVLVEGTSNEAARLRYEQIDVMIDQLHAGWYGGLAVEVMALAKPVMVYIRDEDLQFIPPEMRVELPVLRITVETLKEDLRRLFGMKREHIRELGKRSRQFVERWHDPWRIARQMKRDYERALRELGRA